MRAVQSPWRALGWVDDMLHGLAPVATTKRPDGLGADAAGVSAPQTSQLSGVVLFCVGLMAFHLSYEITGLCGAGEFDGGTGRRR